MIDLNVSLIFYVASVMTVNKRQNNLVVCQRYSMRSHYSSKVQYTADVTKLIPIYHKSHFLLSRC